MLSFYDAILTPIYFLLLLLWVIRWKNKYYHNSPLKKYIIPAFVLKVVCCILLALLYEFYYGYSDSQFFYNGAVDIWNATRQNPIYGLELIFKPVEKWSSVVQQFSVHMSNERYVASTMNLFKISGFIGMFCFGTYLPIALIFTLLSFLGSWKIFIVFVEEFPSHYKKIALTCLFAPSFIFWSTNIMKDPLCIFGLGLCVNSLYNLMKGRRSLFILLEMIVGTFFMLSFKSYIFYIFCFAGFCSIYINIITNNKIKFKIIIRLLMLTILLFITFLAIWQRNYIADAFTNEFMHDVLSIQNVQKEAGGSTYVLSNVEDLSFWGIVKTYFSSLNVALFRPYLWETPNLIAVANALESFVVLLFSFFLLMKLKIIGFFTIAFNNRVLTFALVFALLLAPLAGLVSFNFGTLVRYKAPLVPFYYTYLMILYYKTKERKTETKKSGVS